MLFDISHSDELCFSTVPFSHLSASNNLSSFYISSQYQFPFFVVFFLCFALPFHSFFFLFYFSALHILYDKHGAVPHLKLMENSGRIANEICGRGVHYDSGNFTFKLINWWDFLLSQHVHRVPFSLYAVISMNEWLNDVNFQYSDTNSRQFAPISIQFHQLTTKLMFECICVPCCWHWLHCKCFPYV